MSTTADLPDLNVWLALVWPEHSYQQHAVLRGGEIPARLCTDAHLASLAIANGWRLVCFDRDFERFAGLQRLPLP